eukprot:359983-Chlamydomonas_euryale.AAC.2
MLNRRLGQGMATLNCGGLLRWICGCGGLLRRFCGSNGLLWQICGSGALLRRTCGCGGLLGRIADGDAGRQGRRQTPHK